MYTVEENYQKLQGLINTYPKELKDMIKKGDLEAFKKYIEFYNPITKDLIGAYIHYNYCRGVNIFIMAELANYMLEALEALELQEIISYIEEIYQLYTKNAMLYDTTRIQIRLHIGSMTIEDVLEEEKENREEFQKNIEKYLRILRSGEHFNQLYKKTVASYCRNAEESFEEDLRRKVKALHCANHLYNITKIAEQIHEMAKKIYKIIEEKNPEIIVDIESDKEDNQSKYYYFENEQIDGAIIEEKKSQHEENNYTITSTIQYINIKKEPCVFAKIRIVKDEDGVIQVKGRRTGSCFSENFYDIDFLQHPDSELLRVLKKMKVEVESLLISIEKNPVLTSESYEAKWVKELKSVKNSFD